jgi:hypothetical protein
MATLTLSAPNGRTSVRTTRATRAASQKRKFTLKTPVAAPAAAPAYQNHPLNEQLLLALYKVSDACKALKLAKKRNEFYAHELSDMEGNSYHLALWINFMESDLLEFPGKR